MEENNYHIGLVLFYDERDGFGLIASNNRGMSIPVLDHDLYVVRSSFIEESAKVKNQIVVFQLVENSNWQRRVVNVRKYNSNLETDLKLAITYYEDYEYIQKEGQCFNLFNQLGVEYTRLLPILKHQIEMTPNSTPIEKCNRILHLVKKYKEKQPDSKQYIFSDDYDNENRNLWEGIFSLLRKQDWLELLNIIPSVIQYLHDSSIVSEWINSLSVDISNYERIKELNNIIPIVPEEFKPILREKIENAANKHIESLIERNACGRYLREATNGSNFSTKMEEDISEYLPFTSRNFDSEIIVCKQQVKINNFLAQIESYKEEPTSAKLDDILDLYHTIDSDKDYSCLISELIENRIYFLIDAQSHNDIIDLFSKVERLFPSTAKDIKARITKRITEYLTKNFDIIIANSNLSAFESIFENYKDLLTEEEIKKFKIECRNIILRSNSICLLEKATNSKYHWIEESDKNDRIKTIISQWEFEDINHYLRNIYQDDSVPDLVKKETAFRSFQLIGYELDKPFDGSSNNEYVYFRSDIKEANIRFLQRLKNICISDQLKKQWREYITNLSVDDILTLYDRNIISVLPNNTIAEVIKNLSIQDADNNNLKNWYSAPSFKDSRLKKIFTDSKIDTFNPIASYLKGMNIAKENIALAIWLVELLYANKPDSLTYYALHEWENTFASKLANLKDSVPANKKLGVLLWAVHLRTAANSSALTEVFPWFPPYLQIKIVKRLFYFIGVGKLRFNAHSLYDYLTRTGEQLWLPIEIVFSYLKLREDNTQATFTNSHMLSLIDERDDHQEWFGISKFVVKCNGRWKVDYGNDLERDNWETQLYNGALYKNETSTDLVLYIPHRMIDKRDNLHRYNNKYYRIIQEVIALNIREGSYIIEQESNGIKYSFNENSKIEVLSLVRYFNIHDKLHSKIEYTQSELNDDFCECRLSESVSTNKSLPFYWCDNKPCFRPWVRFHAAEEWMQYTILDFMRILNIPTDYTNKRGKTTQFGYFIMFSSFLKSFARFYEHLKCRKCGEIMHPSNITNFASRSVTEFACCNETCELKGKSVYLNHCFNKPKCDTIIDSRDSKQCSNGQYICPECGGCCSTGNFRKRVNNLRQTGGYISPWLSNFVNRGLGHWELNKRFCFKCGNQMEESTNGFKCKHCSVTYKRY